MTCRQVITIYQRLGGGKTGSVFLCQHPDFPDPIAIKFCPIDPNDPTDALYYAKREYELLLLCRDNPHVTGTMGFSEKGEDYEFITAEGGEWSFNNGENDGALRGVPFLLIDYHKGGTLEQAFNSTLQCPGKTTSYDKTGWEDGKCKHCECKRSEHTKTGESRNLRWLWHDTLKAVMENLHEQGISHGDLYLNNVMLSEDQHSLYLIDLAFGQVQEPQHTKLDADVNRPNGIPDWLKWETNSNDGVRKRDDEGYKGHKDKPLDHPARQCGLDRLLEVMRPTDDERGPHSLTNLQRWWINSGCSESGTAYPANVDDAQTVWWNQRTVADVKADMAAFKSNAEKGVGSYQERVVGYK